MWFYYYCITLNYSHLIGNEMKVDTNYSTFCVPNYVQL